MATRNIWPTPRAHDGLGGGSPNRRWGKHNLPDRVSVDVRGPLNPKWVEWLMNWPMNWAAADTKVTDSEIDMWKKNSTHGSLQNKWYGADPSTVPQGVPRV